MSWIFPFRARTIVTYSIATVRMVYDICSVVIVGNTNAKTPLTMVARILYDKAWHFKTKCSRHHRLIRRWFVDVHFRIATGRPSGLTGVFPSSFFQLAYLAFFRSSLSQPSKSLLDLIWALMRRFDYAYTSLDKPSRFLLSSVVKRRFHFAGMFSSCFLQNVSWHIPQLCSHWLMAIPKTFLGRKT